jgi:N utilization substance protein A
MERGGDSPLFAPLPGEEEAVADVRLSDLDGLNPATVAVLEEGGYRTLNDIIDLEREDFLRLPGIAPAEADRIMSIIEELTTEDGGDDTASADVMGGSTVGDLASGGAGAAPLAEDASLGGERRAET